MPVSPKTANSADVPRIPPPLSSIDLVLRWRKRRQEILNKLPPELRAEYRRLGAAIRAVEDEEREHVIRTVAGVADNVQATAVPIIAPTRLPLARHKATLIDFLRQRGAPVARAEITSSTTIPEGSLSQLLSDREFVQAGRGMWTLREFFGPGVCDADDIPF